MAEKIALPPTVVTLGVASVTSIGALAGWIVKVTGTLVTAMPPVGVPTN